MGVAMLLACPMLYLRNNQCRAFLAVALFVVRGHRPFRIMTTNTNASRITDARRNPDGQRRSQADRSEAMRARLSAAAYETIAEGGLKALRMRSVAEAAGVSQGALLHHFPDKNAVTIAAVEHALDLARQDSEVWLTKVPEDPAALLKAMLAEFRAFFFSDRFWVAIGITLESSKDNELAETVKRRVSAMRKPVYDAWAERLTDAGWTPRQAERDVRGAAALVSGLAIRRFWTENDTVSDELLDDWLAERLRSPH
jgi:AcrR family transcriptional regulator